MSEKQTKTGNHERRNDGERIHKEEHDQYTERLREQLERAEKEHREQTDQHEILKEAQDLADTRDKQPNERTPIPAERRRGPLTKKQLSNSFDSQMTHAREHMQPLSKVFSKFIHIKPVELTSDFIGSTIARPNALLTGSIVAFISVTILYFLANHYGFQLSGFETIAAFIIGWVVGIIYDYAAVAFRKRDR